MHPDYLVLYYTVGFLALLPLLQLKKEPYTYLGYLLVTSAIAGFIPYLGITPVARMQIARDTCRNEFMVLLLCLIVLIKSKASSELIHKILAWFGVFSLLVAIGSHLFGGEAFNGLTLNPRMHGILNVALIPFAQTLSSSWMFLSIIINLLLLYKCESSATYLSFFAIVFVLVVKTEMSLKRKVLFTSLGSIVFLITGELLINRFFDDASRFNTYKFFFSESHNWQSILFGKGPASFFANSIEMQRRLKYFSDDSVLHAWVWMHSDPLQYLYEFGLVGIAFITKILIWVSKRLTVAESCCAASLLAGCLLHYPFHYPPHLFVIFCLLKLATNRSDSGFV